MSEKYTAEQMEQYAIYAAEHSQVTAAMLRQAAQMMRQREVGEAVTDAAVDKAVEAAEKWASENGFVRYMAPTGYTRAALESFAARRASAPDGWRTEVQRAIEIARVFDDGSDGADAESSRSVVGILSAMLTAAPEVKK